MLSLKKNSGRFIAYIKGGENNGCILHLVNNDDNNSSESDEYDFEEYDSEEYDSDDECNYIKLDSGSRFIPLANQEGRECVYICGPSGSGKSTYASEYIRSYLATFPDSDFIAFSRTDINNDPAFEGMNPLQVEINEELVINPIDITSELKTGCIILFDDVTTIQDDKIRKAIEKIIADILEVGRKLKIYIVFTCHLIIGNDKKLARTIMNELTSLTVFPKSGTVQQINYALKTYFGYNEKQISKMLNTSSRWVTFFRTYPQLVLTQKECYIP